MKESIRFKLESVRDRFEEISGLLADPDVIADQNKFRDLSKEYSRVEPIVKLFAEFETLDSDIAAAEEMANDKDEEVRAMGQEELEVLAARREDLLLELQKSLIPPDPTMPMCSSRSGPARAVTRRRYLPATCSGCTASLPK